MNKSLINDLNHLRRTKRGLYFPHLCDKFQIPDHVMTEYICKLHTHHPFFLKSGILVDYDRNSWGDWFVEISTGFTDTDGRYKKRRGKTIPINNLDKAVFQHQRRKTVDVHMSCFAHDKQWVHNAKNTGSVRCQNTQTLMYGLNIDFDRIDIIVTQSFFISWVILNVDLLIGDYDIYHTGNRGYHLYIPGHLFGYPVDLQEKITGKGRLAYNLAHSLITEAQDVTDPWYSNDDEVIKQWTALHGRAPKRSEEKILRKQIEVIDANVYNVNSTIRLPFSYHEKSNQPKAPIYTPQYSLYTPPSERYPPYFLHHTFRHYKEKTKPYETVYKPTDAESTDIITTLETYFEDFNAQKANVAGWVDELHNPHYDDTRPSVSVNIRTGQIIDFGNEDYTMSLTQFVQLMEDCNEQQAERIIKEGKS